MNNSLVEAHLSKRYASREGASAYRSKYKKSWLRRLSNLRELSLVREALKRVDARGRLLDCPCGAGRLTPLLLERSDQVFAADMAFSMIEEARHALQTPGVAFVVNNATQLPYGDRSFDTVLCHRLIHHIGSTEIRIALLGELARVAERFVILSFSDASSMKVRLKAKRGYNSARFAIAPEVLFDEAKLARLEPVSPPRRLSSWTSPLAVVPFRVVRES